ncbi:MAG: hypothetical protein JSS32_07205 [Verrucomicrobia bacterium]|nr:hypothetical protein [Verrucomicrobiota bacterium]
MISTEPRIDNFNWTESFYSIKDQYSDWRQTALKIVLYIPAAILGLIELFVNMGLCILHATCPCLYKKEIVQVQPPTDNNNFENADPVSDSDPLFSQPPQAIFNIQFMPQNQHLVAIEEGNERLDDAEPIPYNDLLQLQIIQHYQQREGALEQVLQRRAPEALAEFKEKHGELPKRGETIAPDIQNDLFIICRKIWVHPSPGNHPQVPMAWMEVANQLDTNNYYFQLQLIAHQDIQIQLKNPFPSKTSDIFADSPALYYEFLSRVAGSVPCALPFPPTPEEIEDDRQHGLEVAKSDLVDMVMNSTLGGFLELASTPTEDTEELDLTPYQLLKDQLQGDAALNWSPAELRKYEMIPDNRPLKQFIALDTIETRLQETNPELLEKIQTEPEASEALLGSDGKKTRSYLERNPGILEELMLYVLGRSGESPL